MVLLQSKSVFDTRLEHGRLQHGDDVLDGSLRRSADEFQTTTLSMLHITGLEHENANSSVGFRYIKADVTFIVGHSFDEQNRLAAGRNLRELLLDDVVG